MNNTPETPAQKPEFYTYRGGNFWTLFTPRTWKVLHAVLQSIFEINVDSYRRRAALERKQNGAGRPQSYATIKDLEVVSPRDNQTET